MPNPTSLESLEYKCPLPTTQPSRAKDLNKIQITNNKFVAFES
jgi:hypothetical protein